MFKVKFLQPSSEYLFKDKLFLLINLPNAGEQAIADKFPPLVCFRTLKIDSKALPFILSGLIKYLPSGETLVKNHWQKDKNPFTTTRRRSQVYKKMAKKQVKNFVFNLCPPYARLPKLKAQKFQKVLKKKKEKETVPCKSTAQQG